MVKVRARGPRALSVVTRWAEGVVGCLRGGTIFRNENCDEEETFDEEETHRLTGHRTSPKDDGTRIILNSSHHRHRAGAMLSLPPIRLGE